MSVRSWTGACVGGGAAWGLNTAFALAATQKTKEATPVLGNPTGALINLVVSLLIVGVLIFLLVRFLAQRAHVPQKGAIELIAARQLAPNRSIQVISVMDKRYLIGVGENVTLLADVSELPIREQTPTSTSQTWGMENRFASALETVRKRYGLSGGSNDDGEGIS